MVIFKQSKLYSFIIKNDKNKILSIIASSIIIILIILCLSYLINQRFTYLPYNATFHGVSLNSLNKSQTDKVINNDINPKFRGKKINLIFENKINELNLDDFNFHFNSKDIFNATSNYDFTKGGEPTVKIAYDKENFDKYMTELSDKIKIDPVHSFANIKGNTLTVTSGKPGYNIDITSSSQQVINAISRMDLFDIVLPSISFDDNFVSINIDKIYKENIKEMQNASYSLDKDGVINYQDEIDGIDFNLELAKSIVVDVNSGSYEIPITITHPSITVKKLKEEHDSSECSNLISSYSTNFSTGAKAENRNYNIAKAASAINDIVLYPGESFSSLRSIGSASKEDGYKESIVYTPQGPTKGAGGGVCQVSTTTYLAAIYGYMDILERHPHSYTVGYVPLGYDAAFSSPGTDMKFKNTRDKPIRIKAFTDESSLTVSIYGTKSDLDNCKVTLNTTISQTIPPSTKQQPTNALPVGKTVIDTQGQNGYVVNTKKTVIKSGSVIEETNIQSNYKPVTKIILIGTNPNINKDPSNQSLLNTLFRKSLYYKEYF